MNGKTRTNRSSVYYIKFNQNLSTDSKDGRTVRFSRVIIKIKKKNN
jgi:hypothetical protein